MVTTWASSYSSSAGAAIPINIVIIPVEPITPVHCKVAVGRAVFAEIWGLIGAVSAVILQIADVLFQDAVPVVLTLHLKNTRHEVFT